MWPETEGEGSAETPGAVLETGHLAQLTEGLESLTWTHSVLAFSLPGHEGEWLSPEKHVP